MPSVIKDASPQLFAEIGNIKLYKEVSAAYLKFVIISRILHLTADATFYLYRKPVRMSYSFDRLATIIHSELDKDLINGDLFIFLNRQRTMIKLLLYEKKGYPTSTGDSMKEAFSCHSSHPILSVTG